MARGKGYKAVARAVLLLGGLALAGCQSVGNAIGTQAGAGEPVILPDASALPPADPEGFLFFFPRDQAEPTALAASALDELADVLRRQPNASVLIVGHIDEAEAARGLTQLDDLRAQSVRRLLIRRGIDDARITVTGQGTREAIQPPGQPPSADQPLNRRVDVLYRQG